MTSFSQLIEGIPHTATSGDLNREIHRVVYDSRAVREGDLFVALRGAKTDGHLFVNEAFERGAAAALVEERVSAPCWAQVKDTLSALALAANRLYGSPADNLRLVGVTGSNGKSTTTYIIETILGHADERVGLLGTIEYRWPGFSKKALHTTPFSSDLQAVLAEMVSENVSTAVMEVSSHGIVLHRLDTLAFDVAVFTNLSHDHLDFHGTMEAYAASKKRLFTEYLRPDGWIVLNQDDRWGREWLSQFPKERTISYGFSRKSQVFPDQFVMSREGIEAEIQTPDGRISFSSNLLGRHNLYNLLASISACLAMEIPLSIIQEAVSGPIQAPGRLEAVDCDQPFTVLVDYAHTPDGLRQALSTLSEIPHGKLTCIVGAGGDRDRKKRPLMARIAQELSDRVILTSDNPRTEDPEKILDEMESGMIGSSPANYLRIPDRSEAIQRGILEASPNDIVLIAGKGHEDYQEINGVRHPFDDRLEARAALEALLAGGGKA